MDTENLQKFIKIGNKFYCPYCGKELEEKEYGHGTRYWEHDTYRLCDCDDAKEEYRIMQEIVRLEEKLPKVKYEAALQVVKKDT